MSDEEDFGFRLPTVPARPEPEASPSPTEVRAVRKRKRQPLTSEVMLQIVRKAMNTAGGLKIWFPSQQEAISFRVRYYQVRSNIVRKDPESDWRLYSCFMDKEATKEKGHIVEVSSSHQTPEALWEEYLLRLKERSAWGVKIVPVDTQILSYEMEEIPETDLYED